MPLSFEGPSVAEVAREEEVAGRVWALELVAVVGRAMLEAYEALAEC